MDKSEKRYMTKDLADMLGVEAVTIRKYALALEKAGYEIDRSDGKNRSFSERDAMAFKYLQTLRSRTGITVESAAEVVAARNNADTQNGGSIVRSGKDEISDRYDERYAELLARFAELTEIVRQHTAVAAVLPSPQAQRMERLNERITERKVERLLRKEALEEWVKKPLAERTRRVGFFRREEDTVACDRFVQQYIDDNFELRIKTEYGIDT